MPARKRIAIVARPPGDFVINPAYYRAARKKRGLTQEQLARLVGVTRETIVHREAGKTPISVEADMALRLIPLPGIREVDRGVYTGGVAADGTLYEHQIPETDTQHRAETGRRGRPRKDWTIYREKE